jgi:hypothetical protein
MGSGALLLNGDTPAALESFFTPGVHLVTFADLEDAADKVRHYLSHEEERAAIARAGCAEVHARHSWDVRMTALLQALAASPGNGLPAHTAPARSMKPVDVEDIYHRRYQQAGHVDALLRRAATCPRWSRRRALTLWRAAATAVSVSRRA